MAVYFPRTELIELLEFTNIRGGKSGEQKPSSQSLEQAIKNAQGQLEKASFASFDKRAFEELSEKVFNCFRESVESFEKGLEFRCYQSNGYLEFDKDVEYDSVKRVAAFSESYFAKVHDKGFADATKKLTELVAYYTLFKIKRIQIRLLEEFDFGHVNKETIWSLGKASASLQNSALRILKSPANRDLVDETLDQTRALEKRMGSLSEVRTLDLQEDVLESSLEDLKDDMRTAAKEFAKGIGVTANEDVNFFKSVIRVLSKCFEEASRAADEDNVGKLQIMDYESKYAYDLAKDALKRANQPEGVKVYTAVIKLKRAQVVLMHKFALFKSGHPEFLAALRGYSSRLEQRLSKTLSIKEEEKAEKNLQEVIKLKKDLYRCIDGACSSMGIFSFVRQLR